MITSHAGYDVTIISTSAVDFDFVLPGSLTTTGDIARVRITVRPPPVSAMDTPLSPTAATATKTVATGVSAVSGVTSVGSPAAVTSAAMTAMLSSGPCNPKSVQEASASMFWISNPAGEIFGRDAMSPVTGNVVAVLICWVVHGAAVVGMFVYHGDKDVRAAMARARWPSLSLVPTTFFYHAIAFNAMADILGAGWASWARVLIAVLALVMFGAGPIVTVLLISREVNANARYDESTTLWRSKGTKLLKERFGFFFTDYRKGRHNFLALELARHSVLCFCSNMYRVSDCIVQGSLTVTVLAFFFVATVYLHPRKRYALMVLDGVMSLCQLLAVSLTFYVMRTDDATSLEAVSYLFMVSYMIVGAHSVLMIAYSCIDFYNFHSSPPMMEEIDIPRNPIGSVFAVKLRELMKKHPVVQDKFV